MTQEWIDWSGENRVRTPLRGGGCNNFLNNNYTTQKVVFGMGLKANTLMKSTQRPKGNAQYLWIFYSTPHCSIVKTKNCNQKYDEWE